MTYEWQPIACRPYVGYAPEREIPGTITRQLHKDVQWQDEYGAAGWSRVEATIDDAEVVSSHIAHSNLHAPVLDLDVPHVLVPSTTPGHAHLYLDVPMTWRRYKRLLRALARAGVVEKGYVKASLRRKHTAVRVPWLRKGEDSRRPTMREVVRKFKSSHTHLADIEMATAALAFGKVYRKPPEDTVALCGVRIRDGVVMQSGTKVKCRACHHLAGD